MGAFWETLAKVFGALGALDQQQIAYPTFHSLLFLLAPLWVNAFVYMTFARLVHHWLPEKRIKIIRATSIAKYFVIADMVSFIVQGAGGMMASPASPQRVVKAGLNVYMAGMGLQEAFILLFTFLMVLFQRRVKELEVTEGTYCERNWRPLLYALHGALAAITVSAFLFSLYAAGRNPQ